MAAIEAFALAGLPEIEPRRRPRGADRRGRAGARATATSSSIAHKASPRRRAALRRLAEIAPDAARARARGRSTARTPATCRRSSTSRSSWCARARGVLIVRTRHGFVCANAGIDESNAPADGVLVLLPLDPDGAARALRARLASLTGRAPGGRDHRQLRPRLAPSASSTPRSASPACAPLDDWRGRSDRRGRELHATVLAIADAVAAAADLARTKNSGEPVVIVRGLAAHVTDDDGPGRGARCCARGGRGPVPAESGVRACTDPGAGACTRSPLRVHAPAGRLLGVQLAQLVAQRLRAAPLRLDRDAALADLAQRQLARDPGVVQQAQRHVHGLDRGRVAEAVRDQQPPVPVVLGVGLRVGHDEEDGGVDVARLVGIRRSSSRSVQSSGSDSTISVKAAARGIANAKPNI